MKTDRDSRRGSSLGMLRAALALASLSTLTATGCGDGPICQAEVLVIIQSPSGPVLADSNLVEDGVQTDVRVRTTLGAEVDVVLTVLGEDDEVLGTVTVATDEDGDATFEDVTLPAGALALRAFADGGECGSDEDQVALDVAAGRDCALTIRQTPAEVDFYAPLGVLNLSNDDDAAMPNFQADIDVTTQPGFDVELFVIGGDTGVETSAGVETASGDGEASFAISLAQGRQSVRAVCSATSGAVSSPSLTTSVYVDTDAPDCAMTAPAPGTTITPALDDDKDLGNGVQLTLEAHAPDDDVEGEAVVFAVTVDGTTSDLDGTAFDDFGDSEVAATIDPATAPSTATVVLTSQDHAANGCEVTETYAVVYDGCGIEVVAPTTTVIVDADGNGGNGIQVDVDLQVDTDCAGRLVTSDCGLTDPSGTVQGNGSLTLRVQMCGTAVCDVTELCEFSVSTASGIETTDAQSIHFDNQAPAVSVGFLPSTIACGSSLTPAADIDLVTDGVQVRMRVVSLLSVTRRLEQTTGAGTVSFDANPSSLVVTLSSGVNSFVGFATDENGNTAQSATCTATLTDVVVTFLPPAADGAIGAIDGVQAGTDLSFDLCGQVSSAGAAVAVTVDGGAAIPATVVGNDWCVPLVLAGSPPSHTIVATATAPGPLVGTATLVLSVDLSTPDPITNLGAVADTRQSLRATWTAPSDGGAAAASYLVKVSTTALNEGNFDSTGEQVIVPAPQAPGGAESVRITARRAGTAYWVGVAPVDAAGNRSTAAIVGPVTPRFDQSAAVLPPIDLGDANFGFALARGKFNDDEFWDVAVSAPGERVGGVVGVGAVYIYFGGATGLAATPDVTIRGETLYGGFGFAMTAIRWSSTTRDDLVIGEPYGNNVDGGVYIFEGGFQFQAGDYGPADADRVIGVHPVNNYFTTGGLGSSLASLDFDGDLRPDLAIGDALGGGNNGGLAIVYGGTVTGPLVLLSDADPSQLAGAVVHLMDDPQVVDVDYDIFSNYVYNLGRTQGGTDLTDDLAVSYADGTHQLYVLRGSTTRPTTSGVYPRVFAPNQDVRIDYATADADTEFGTGVGSIADLNGDGARDIVIGAYRDGNDDGKVLIVDGNTLGTAGVASTAAPGVVVTTITPGPGVSYLGTVIVNNTLSPTSDVDGDGLEDLLIMSKSGGVAQMQVWYGGSIPTGSVTTASAPYTIAGPATFTGIVPPFFGTPHAASWVGDVNGDGLGDICWSDAFGNGLDGSFQVLWDDGN